MELPPPSAKMVELERLYARRCKELKGQPMAIQKSILLPILEEYYQLVQQEIAERD